MKNSRQSIKFCKIPEIESRSLYLDHVRLRPGEQITVNQHNTWELSYIVSGSGMRMIGDTLEPFNSGEIVLIPPNLPHCWSFDELDTDSEGNIENITIFFPPDLLDNLATSFAELKPCCDRIQDHKDAMLLIGDTLLKAREIMWQASFEQEVDRLLSFLRILSLISEAEKMSVVGSLVEEDKRTKKMQQIYSYVMNNFQRSITLNDVSTFVGMDRSSFCTFFKKMANKTFFAFLSEYRIESSCQMLRKTTMSVAEICVAVGFNDIPHYNRVFKKLKKLTPTQYRKL